MESVSNLIWWPDTCYCEIECTRPSVNGIFKKRCTIHAVTINTTDVYSHNIQSKFRFLSLDKTELETARQKEGNNEELDATDLAILAQAKVIEDKIEAEKARSKP